MPIDAQGMTFTFNNAALGGVHSYQIFDGNTPDIEHNPLDGSGRNYFPGVPEYGQVVFNTYIDPADPGIIAMNAARASRQRVTCVLTPRGGAAQTFLGYVKVLPIIGENIGVQTSRIVIKVAGAVT